MLKRFFLVFACLALLMPSVAQDQNTGENKRNGLGVSLAANYTFSGLTLILDVEWQKNHHIFYTGPKLPLSRTYLPFNRLYGWNIGYRHEYDKEGKKKISFFFNADYQVGFSKAYSQVNESGKMNYIHELFLGYGVQYKLSPRLFLANVMGVGGHFESYYNIDLDLRRSYAGYNNLFKFFLNYKF
jgi:hypothetical protein